MQNILDKLSQARASGKISETAYANIYKWLTGKEYQEYWEAISSQIEGERFKELEDTFYTIIPFGTGGRRGTCGVGPNRMNARTIGESAQGLAAYIEKFGAEEAKARGVVIAYDTRLTSPAFANVAASVLTGNGVKTYIFSSFRSTPELSFAVRELKTMAGIVISASHNPPSDNGFKVYWEDGGQIVAPHDVAIIQEVNAVTMLKTMDLGEAEKQGLLKKIDREIDEPYVQAVVKMSLTHNRNVKIIYSPLHGTGQTSILPVLQAAGFTQLYLVEEQMSADGNFPNVAANFPNPELPAASERAMAVAREIDADLGLTSDPDADRLGVFCKHANADGKADWVLLNGNQVGALLTDFILSKLQELGRLPQQGVVVKTLVTTDLVSRIAKSFGMATVSNLLVGFKYIAEVIRNLPSNQEFIFGAEESLGYLRGTFVRDKDAAIAAITVAEMAAELKAEGESLIDHLHKLYRKHGYFAELLKNMYVPGAEGTARVKKMMKVLREQPPLKLGDKRVIEVVDRQVGVAIAPETGKVIRQVEGIKGNVLIFVLSDDQHTRVTIRPSGTEPKIKYYGAIRKDIPVGMMDEEFFQLKIETDARLESYVNNLIAEAEKRG
ncbi:phosphomannomutase [Candidatus Moduliflexus flocculans]|uniref:Phosphomannomutase n=1 Tax=Candidatus Moduliflexus flocculans TaxID=1499966 RepID=A0A0S6W3P4_9BACT|nr:phosphomannomutase [Candidatus Moduliflexus flocculans]